MEDAYNDLLHINLFLNRPKMHDVMMVRVKEHVDLFLHLAAAYYNVHFTGPHPMVLSMNQVKFRLNLRPSEACLIVL